MGGAFQSAGDVCQARQRPVSGNACARNSKKLGSLLHRARRLDRGPLDLSWCPFLAVTRMTAPAFASPLSAGLARGGSPLRESRSRRGHSAAGHHAYEGGTSFSGNLTGSGQIHSWRSLNARASTSPGRGHRQPSFANRPAWNERIPVWEQRIPVWQTGLNNMPSDLYRMHPQSRERTFDPMASQMTNLSMGSATKSQVITRDWSLLFSPGRAETLVRRPWPEYEPETSAAVGRRWCGNNLGRLYEHVLPTSSMMSSPLGSSSASMRGV